MENEYFLETTMNEKKSIERLEDSDSMFREIVARLKELGVWEEE